MSSETKSANVCVICADVSTAAPDDVELDTEHNQLRIALEKRGDDEHRGFNASTWQRWIPAWKVNYERLCRGEPDATSVSDVSRSRGEMQPSFRSIKLTYP